MRKARRPARLFSFERTVHTDDERVVDVIDQRS
jgi:hypothetical protein